MLRLEIVIVLLFPMVGLIPDKTKCRASDRMQKKIKDYVEIFGRNAETCVDSAEITSDYAKI